MCSTDALNHLNSGIPNYRILPDPYRNLARPCARHSPYIGLWLRFRQRQQPQYAQARDQPSAASNLFTPSLPPRPASTHSAFDTNCKVD